MRDRVAMRVVIWIFFLKNLIAPSPHRSERDRVAAPYMLFLLGRHEKINKLRTTVLAHIDAAACELHFE